MYSNTRVAYRYLTGAATETDLPALEDALRNLEVLDMTLTAIEDTFNDHMTGKVAAVEIPDISTYVASQTDSLAKARKGLEAAKGIEKSVKEILTLDPENKTAQRAATDAATMIKRFGKHEEEARKLIQTAAKQKMPPALKKMGDAVLAALKPRLVDPRTVEMVPWVQHNASTFVYDPGTPREGVCYYLIFKLHTQPEMREDMRFSLREHTATRKGVELHLYEYGSPVPATDAKTIANQMIGALGEWSGIKGKVEEGTDRATKAQDISRVALDVARRLGDVRGETPEITNNNKNISVTFRTDLRSEDYGEYDEEWEHKGNRYYLEPLKKALASYMTDIQKVSLVYNEKGWWTFYVTLK